MKVVTGIVAILLTVTGCQSVPEDSRDLEWWDSHVRLLNDVLVNQGDLDRIPEFISMDYTVHTADTRYSGRALVYNFISDLRAAFPDLVVEEWGRLRGERLR